MAYKHIQILLDKSRRSYGVVAPHIEFEFINQLGYGENIPGLQSVSIGISANEREAIKKNSIGASLYRPAFEIINLSMCSESLCAEGVGSPFFPFSESRYDMERSAKNDKTEQGRRRRREKEKKRKKT